MLNLREIVVRRAQLSDSETLLSLMRKLAQFEHYADQFAVDIRALQMAAFGSTPLCQIWVAQQHTDLIAYAVTYLIPYTYDLRPTLVLKELYVDEGQRSAGVGQQLFIAAVQFARSQNAARMKWDVLRGNQRAEQFYQGLGAKAEAKWLAYGLDETGIQRLSISKDETLI